MRPRIIAQWLRLKAYLFHQRSFGVQRLPWHAETLRFLIMAARMFWRNDLLTRGAALAFITTISIFPLAAVVLTLLPVFFHPVKIATERSAPNGLTTTTTLAVPKTSVVLENLDEEPTSAPEQAANRVAQAIADHLLQEQATTRTLLAPNEQDYAIEVGSFLVEAIAPAGASKNWKHSLVEWFAKYQQRAESVGAIGVIALLTGALALYNTAQEATNRVWQAKRRRSRLQTVAVFSGILLWIPLLVFLSLYAKNKLLAYSDYIAQPASVLIPGLFSLIFFTAVYRYMPTVQVRWTSAVFGGLIATVLWMMAKGSIAHYIVHARNIRNLVLTLGAIPYFILWMYVCWVVLLLGAVISYTHQNYESLLTMEAEETVSVIDPLVLLMLACVIAKNFMEGRGGMGYDELRDLCPVPQAMLNDHLSYLEKHNYICQRADSSSYILQRPADTIPIKEFMLLSRRAEHLRLSDEELNARMGMFLGEVDTGLLGFLGEMNLEELAQRLGQDGARQAP